MCMAKQAQPSDRKLHSSKAGDTLRSGIPERSGMDHESVEALWKEKWKEIALDVIDVKAASKPFYNLMMFPYPSAEGMHIGNMYAFTGSDVYGRFKQMQGYDVLEPIGLDGFGIHSENYALKIGRHPMDHAKVTQTNFYNQLYKIGSKYDWSKTLETYDPAYYRWTQWLFVKMFKYGLAYRKTAKVNYCLSCKTVLSDEQVIDGACERCGNNVEKRALEQWFFRITAYAEKLQRNIPALKWSEIVKTAQKNWIGKKEGIVITYDVFDGSATKVGEVSCFTTRPDTNYGATFVALAPEHPLTHAIISTSLGVIEKTQRDRIGQYVEEATKKSEEERVSEGRKKTGIDTTLYALNHLTGKKMPLYVSDFVLGGFGTGAVVGVPGHDKRDFAFAQAFNLPIIRVVKGSDGDTSPITKIEQVEENDGIMMNSEFLNGMDILKAIPDIINHIEKQGWGQRETTYHLRDWTISRQRYWGAPIPMIFCQSCAKAGKSWFTSPECIEYQKGSLSANKTGARIGATEGEWNAVGWYPVNDADLPVILPHIDDYKPTDDGISPLAKHKEFYETTCPGCGGKAVRETDVSDTFLDSSWYFFRYPSIGSATEKTKAFDPDITKKWLPVSMYTGGAEHSVLHLLYSRFMTMVLHDMGYIDFDEPYENFYAHGLIIKDGAKMSKSKGNVVSLDEYIDRYGADALRMYLMFMGPFSQGGDFRDASMEGMSRWAGRVWRMAKKAISNKTPTQSHDKEISSALAKLIVKVTDDMEKRRYNTAIASMMEFTNIISGKDVVLGTDELKTLLILLAPFAPFLTEDLWQQLHSRAPKTVTKNDSIHSQKWPVADQTSILDEAVTIVVSVNGKTRDFLKVPSGEAGDTKKLEDLARKSEKVAKFTQSGILKVIVVPNKLVNFVVKSA
jgi:leucyl-tRNA synthetase